MLLIPFINDPYAKLIILREISRSAKDYKLIQSLPNSAEIVVDIFDRGIDWLTKHPRTFVFPEVKAKGWTFRPPTATFEDLTFEQLVDLEILFNRFLRFEIAAQNSVLVPKQTHFDKFLSVFYHVAEAGKMDKLKAIATIPYPYRLDAFRMYCGLRDRIFKRFTSLFPHTSNASEKGVSKAIDFSKIPDNTDMWHGLLFVLADSPAFQGMETAKKAPIWDALTYLDEKALQAVKMKEATEKQRDAMIRKRK